ncbi:hypothetical protein DL240_06890 [Lujinxingia litoralis]|uniref:Endonuclease I n=1 Tax=Lujinxingia litoralis TaxID=2211119 RepID=A0A328CBJ6_9DELT|nr:endonuclease [Lujinxingia litoralis]RAL23869.1 hypothetical protein DL240_06890 [Lujinxingia litoralis]
MLLRSLLLSPSLLLVIALSACVDPQAGTLPPDTDLPDLGTPDAGDDVDADTDAPQDTDPRSDADDSGPTEPAPPEPWSCDPDLDLNDRRYRHLDALGDEEFERGLFNMVDGHRAFYYSTARGYLFNDIEPREDGKIECAYTARRVEPDGSNTPGGLNTEHVWPQSRGADEEPARSDLHHLFPVDAGANSARSNHPYGTTSCSGNACPWHESGSERGPATDGRDPVFEVRPSTRGNVARAMFYFALRYELPIESREEAVLRQWHCEDPPDDFERQRNDLIQMLQSNRNPFVDRPDFVDRFDDF